ncbi:D-alanyl-D-alanine carboxypeptidase family protein [Clostridium sp.]|uniref:D-alanyl-D-alanine carboxypeptidase family protein n=1 Tax=Clostridium sp. TaxID=1506 RepID=UPI003217BA06
MRKLMFILLSIFTISLFNYSDVYALSKPPSVTGKSVVVMDANTGAVVYGTEENTQYPPASTTKLMTILLTLENCDLDEVVTVGEFPPTIEGSKIYVDVNEKMTVEEMLYSVIMVSANDCAAALAEHISGSIEDFSTLMNKRAKELGCKNTNFVNPHGLYDEKHRTTAYDLALIEKELLKYPKYIKISQTTSTFLEPTNIFKEQRPLWNDNKLLHDYYDYYYPGVIAGKTGYTDESLHSFVASAKKDDNAFIVAILFDEKKAYFQETPQLFDWAFENFSTEKLFSKGDEIGTYQTSNGSVIPLLAAEDIFYTKDTTSSDSPIVTIDKAALENKFFNKGDVVTTVSIVYNNQNYTGNVTSNSDYSQEVLPVMGDLFTTTDNTINYNKLFFIIGSCIVSLIMLFFISRTIIKRRNLAKKRKNLFSSENSYKRKY